MDTKRAARVVCGDTCIHSLKTMSGKCAGSTDGIALCVILQLLDWGFTSKSVGYVVPQPFAKRIKNLDP